METSFRRDTNPNPLLSPNNHTSNSSTNSNNNGLQAPPTTQPPKPMIQVRLNLQDPHLGMSLRDDFSPAVAKFMLLTKAHLFKPTFPASKESGEEKVMNWEDTKNLRLNPLIPIPVFNSKYNNNSGFSPETRRFCRQASSISRRWCSAPSRRSYPTRLTEEKAIKEKRFYLTPRESEPQLLPLFPKTSPRASGSSSS